MDAQDLVTAVLRRAAAGDRAIGCRTLVDGEVGGEAVERSWKAFCEGAVRLAGGLQAAGARGERVLLLYPPGIGFAEGFVACVLAGAVAVPALPPDPRRLERTLPRLTRIAVDAGARFVLAPAGLCAMAESMAEMAPELARRPWLAAEVSAAAGAPWRDPGAGPGTLAYLQYTSGSTGEPKGVRVTHANLLHNVANIHRAFRCHAGSVGVIWLPPYHDMGLIGGILTPLLAGFAVTWMSPLDFLQRPARWLRAVSAARATISGGPDFAYALCTRKVRDEDLVGLDLSSWEVAFSGAEPVRADTLAAFERRFAGCGLRRGALYPTYGLAEATLIVTGGRALAGPRALELDGSALARGVVAAGAGRTLVSCGEPLAGMEVVIVDPATGAPSDEVGEVWVAGPSVADGYWERPVASAEVFAARTADGRGPYLRTGDLGLVRDGCLYIVGRQKDVIIVRGRNIHPADVEAAIAGAHPAIRPGGIAVFRVEHGGEERAAAAVEVDVLRAAGFDEVIEAVRGAAAEAAGVGLAGVMLLASGAMPKTTSGKVQRFEARALYMNADAPGLARWSEAAAAIAAEVVDSVRRRLLATVAPYLGVAPERVDAQRSFEAYGVDSARLVEMSEAVQRAFDNCSLPPSAFYNHPNLDALARYLAAQAPAPPVRVGGGMYAESEGVAHLDRRGTGYRFDLEADVPWGRLGEPGVHVPEALAAALGVDVAGLRAAPGAWELGEWALALEICEGFEALELALILVCKQVEAAYGPSRSLQLLADEEDKHILLFRRYARRLRELRPGDAEVFAGLPMSYANRRGQARLELTGAADHYRVWLWTLMFEAWTIHVHELLSRAEGVQPTWSAAHGLHRREEAQHLATDLAFVSALALPEDERQRHAAAFLCELLATWDEFFGVSTVVAMVAARHPGLALRRADAAACAQRLLGERSFASLMRAAPGLAELLARPAGEVRAAAAAVAGSAGERWMAWVPRSDGARRADAAVRAARAFEEEDAETVREERAVRDDRAEPVAIVGFGCRFPGEVGSLEALWDALVAGVDAITEVPADRWDIGAWYDPTPGAPGKMYTRWGGFLRGVDEFDAGFFGISPREARTMDPQQRLLLEVTWEALEHAGVAPASLAGTRTGVWVGICSWDYARRNHDEPLDPWSVTGNALSVAAGRISYVLGLRGPAMAVDTACSSSLVGVHLAVQSLRRGESELALVGGVNLILTPASTVCFSQLRAMSPVGRCKTFDASADGYVRSEACSVVVLKRLRDARRDGDRVLAVIRGTAVNQDGRSNGLTAPHGPAQEDVMRAALADAGLQAEDLGYLEAHGTGTGLGDPIELGAIGAVMAGRGAPLWVGSVKTNLGHSEGASGLAGLAKVVAMLRAGQVPPNLHFVTPTPKVEWSRLPVRVPTALQAWPDGPRRAGINSFGFSGTNAHVVVESAAECVAPATEAPPLLVLPLSAPTRAGLQALAGRLAEHLERRPEDDVADVCATLACGRNAWAERVALVVRDRSTLVADLRQLAGGEVPAGAFASPEDGAAADLRVAFLCTGQGAQAPGMARGLYAQLPAFRAAFDRAAAAVDPWLARPVAQVMFAEDPEIHETGWAQPALFALEWALAATWRALGVEPCALLGHSIGEIAAACVAGVLSLADAGRLVAARGRLMQSLPRGGAMVSVEADEATVSAVVAPLLARLDIAAINGPRQVVISGDADAALAAVRELSGRGVRTRGLTVSHAFHSPRMDPILDAFEAEARRATLSRPRVPLVSNLTGRMAGADVVRAGYWALHVRSPVRFADGVATLMANQRPGLLVEIGPVLGLLGLCAQAGVQVPGVASLRTGQADAGVFAAALARAWACGAGVRWSALFGQRRRLTLPGTPMRRVRHWIELTPRATVAGVGPAHPWLGARLDVAGSAVFEASLGEAGHPWLADHRVGERAILPFTGWVELARAAVALAGLGDGLGAVNVEAPLGFAAGESHRVQVRADERGVEIFARAGDGWRRHCTAAPGGAGEAATIDVAAIAGRCPEAWSGEALRAAMAAAGLPYGPRFAGLSTARRGAGEALAELQAPAALAGEPGFVRRIALLDAALQAAGLLLADEGLHLPVGAEAVAGGELPDRCWAHAALRAGPGVRRVDVVVADERGAVVGRVTGLELRRVGGAAKEPPLGEEAWELAAVPIEELVSEETGRSAGGDAGSAGRAGQVSEGTGRWSGGDAGSAGRAGQVSEGTGRGAVVDAGRAGQVSEGTGRGAADAGSAGRSDRVTEGAGRAVRALIVGADPVGGALMARLAAGSEWTTAGDGDALVRQLRGGRFAVVVWLAGHAESSRAPAPDVGQALAVVRAAGAVPGTRVVVVTRGGYVAEGERATAQAVGQAGLWGLVRSAMLELGSTPIRLVDLDPRDAAEAAAASLARELGEDGEPQVVWRHGVRHALRLAPVAADELERPEGDARLAIDPRGGLQMLAEARREPAAGEVAIAVEFAGLNFRDVLGSLGRYRGAVGPLGGECCGRVIAVGAGVTELVVGDRVMAIAPASFADVAYTDARLAVRVPAGLTSEEAATVPVAFATAWYGLHTLGRLRAGERVLIHAAAGGVGMAAVQLARRAGAEVFGTASAGKWSALREMGIAAPLCSRDTSFAPAIQAATNGEGIDLVLNSLTGEILIKSLELLRAGGRFVEMGKAEILDGAQVAAINPGAEYSVFDLAVVDPATLGEILREIAEGLRRGALRPLPHRTVPLTRAPAAFRDMAAARHVGKIVLQVPRDLPLDPDGVYVVTGATGGLGPHVARWLVGRGARRVVLAGRSTPAAALVDELTAGGATVLSVRVDLAEPGGVRTLLAEARALGQVRGVVHAAGVLADGALGGLDAGAFARVLAPKAAAAWDLSEETAADPIHLFVLFGSAAGVLGGAGQANYAAANAMLDALARGRRAEGLAGLAIDWGPWAGEGMAGRQDPVMQRRLIAQGIRALAPARGLRHLDAALRGAAAQVVVVPFDRSRLTGPVPALLRGLVAEAPAAAKPDGLRGALEQAAPAERRDRLISALRKSAAQVLGAHPGAVDPRRPLSDLGLDSLMAVDLQNTLAGALGLTLAPTVLLEHPTLEALATYVLAALGLNEAAGAPATGAADAAAQLRGEIEALEALMT